MARDLTLRLAGAAYKLAGWSGYPSIAALSINPTIDRRDGPLGNIMHSWK